VTIASYYYLYVKGAYAKSLKKDYDDEDKIALGDNIDLIAIDSEHRLKIAHRDSKKESEAKISEYYKSLKEILEKLADTKREDILVPWYVYDDKKEVDSKTNAALEDARKDQLAAIAAKAKEPSKEDAPKDLDKEGEGEGDDAKKVDDKKEDKKADNKKDAKKAEEPKVEVVTVDKIKYIVGPFDGFITTLSVQDKEANKGAKGLEVQLKNVKIGEKSGFEYLV